MGQIIPTKISRFDGAMSDDPRQPSSNMGSLIKHFDCFSAPNKLTPYRSVEADHTADSSSTGAKTYDLRDFLLASNGKEYALGKNASGYPKVLRKEDPTTGAWLASDGTAAATAIGEGTAARISGCFIEWQGYLIFLEGTNQITKVLISTGVASSVGTVGSTITSVAQPIIANNTLYLFYNNKIVSISAALAVSDNLFTTLPSDMRITSVARFGAYLMLGMAFGSSNINKPVGRSIVVQWDMNSTTTPSDTLDWGEGALRVLGNIEGRICGVSDKYLSSSLGLTRGSMVVRLWAGGAPQVIKEVVANQTVTADVTAFPNSVTRFPNQCVIKNNKMYWVASVPFGLSTSTESTHHLGIWVFGRKTVNSDFTISVDYIIDSVIDTANFRINSFGAAGDFWFLNHSADGSIAKTDDASTYSETSVYESQIFNAGDLASYKSLVDVTVGSVYLPTAGQIVVKYRIDNETSYTTIFTNTTDASISHTANNIESDGSALPKKYKEIQFQVLSTGGAELTELSFNEEITGRIYDTA